MAQGGIDQGRGYLTLFLDCLLNANQIGLL